MKLYARGGSTPAVRVFVTICFAVWAGASYMAVFVLATAFWVAYLESEFRPGAFAEYAAVLALALASAFGALWLWRRVNEYPWLYVTWAWIFGVVILTALFTAAVLALL